uniref:Calpain catalytic domain-containing protein n=1 Tax=Sander lucioperca TaxID=283035 RepID=A0A8C9ZV78_SANLU
MTSPADRLARQQDREQGIGTNKKAVKFSQQDYETLREQCLKSGRLFEDNCFPAEPTSLGYKKLGPHSPKTKGVVWKRPKELCSNPKFIDDGATRMDICQGELGDCWLLAAIASLTLDQEILARVVPQEQSFTEGYAGIFHFQFWQFGEWVDVVIDDRLPTRDGKLLFVHSAEGSEFWSALLEKAYAKLYGSYEALIEGNTTEGFEDFTGGIAEIYTLEETPPKLFQIMQKALSLGSLLGCSIKTTSANEVEKRTALNLFKGHAYSVTGAEEVHFQGKPVQLVRMRNPWGYKEWTGPWSDKSIEWNHLSQDEKSKLNHVADDGEFWMSYSDFIKQFSRLEICNLTPDSLMSDEVGHWNHYQFEGTWREGSTAGGCRNYPDTFSSNPQFVVRLEDVDDDPLDGKDGCTFLVGLMQKGGRQQKLGFNPEFIGFAIYKVPQNNLINVHLGPDALQSCVAESSFANTREVCNRFKLPPGEYAIVPSTFQPDKNGSFLLRVFSEKQAAARYCVTVTYRLIDDMEVSAFELVEILNKVFSQRSDIKTDGFSLETGRLIVSLLDNIMLTDGYFSSTGFQVNSAVLQSIVSRYSDAQYVIDFDSFVGCLIKLEMLFKMFKTLERADTGKIELDMQQVCKTITKAAGLSGLLV